MTPNFGNHFSIEVELGIQQMPFLKLVILISRLENADGDIPCDFQSLSYFSYFLLSIILVAITWKSLWSTCETGDMMLVKAGLLLIVFFPSMKKTISAPCPALNGWRDLAYFISSMGTGCLAPSSGGYPSLIMWPVLWQGPKVGCDPPLCLNNSLIVLLSAAN